MPRGTAITQKKTWHSCTSVIYSCMAKTGQGNHAEWQKPKKEITLIGRNRKRKSCWMAKTGKGNHAEWQKPEKGNLAKWQKPEKGNLTEWQKPEKGNLAEWQKPEKGNHSSAILT